MVQERVRTQSGAFGRSRGWRRLAVVALFVLVPTGALVFWGATGLGYWLVVADPLTSARAIVVLSGHVPFRAMEAAFLYRQGWASEVWLTRHASTAEDAALARLGLQVIPEHVQNRMVLQRLEVPSGAIRELAEEIVNTADEVRVVSRELQRVGGDRVILVTSKVHTRRVRATWGVLVGDTHPVIVRYARDDPYEPGRWWQHTQTAMRVLYEFFGLVNVWARFPLKPARP